MGKTNSAEQEERRDKLGALGDAPQLRILPYGEATCTVISELPHIAQQSHPADPCHVGGHTEPSVNTDRMLFRASHSGLVLSRSWPPSISSLLKQLPGLWPHRYLTHQFPLWTWCSGFRIYHPRMLLKLTQGPRATNVAVLPATS